jgi:D-alanine--poly(phosphoribitol) ligase subunit 1
MQKSVVEYFEYTANANPDKVAVKDDEKALSFGELRIQALSLADEIETCIGSECVPVALLLPKSVDWIIGLLACLYAGKIYTPLDINTPVNRLKKVHAKLGAKAVIINEKTRALAIQADFGDNDMLSIKSEATSTVCMVDTWRQRLDVDPAYIIHTSGSTGTPKGVAISHRSIIDYIDWAIETYKITGAEVIGNQAPYYFDNSTLDFYLSFATGATLVLIPNQHFSFPARLMGFLLKEDVSFIFWVPSIMVNIANLNLLNNSSGPPLTKILFAGEVMSNRQLNQWRKAFPNALFSNLYGPTEITVDCTYLIVDRPFGDDEALPIGLPCRNSDILILDDNKRVCGLGQIGELCVRGTSLALGYWGDLVMTKEKFTQNPLNTKYPEKIYRTGDLVSYNDHGEIMFHGRIDSQIKHQGFRIELGEIENACLTIQNVKNACILYKQDQKQIVLIYEAESLISPAEIRSELGATLPKYMLPTDFHHIENMPMNPNGKIDRSALQVMIDDKITNQ